MNRPETVPLEPFAEITSNTYRFGYRIVGTSNYAFVVEVPIPIVEQTVLTRATLTARVSPDGTVTSSMIMSTGSTPDLLTAATSIDALVQRAVNAENLRMEEATAADLSTFLQRLEDSVRLVKYATSQTGSETKTALKTTD
ncbi:hypothetical protein [Bradyrhizobium valentinum]|nr:hypothetical protein [Bradyrhizobium valentinum]KRR08737.1 hypothetical protein CQ10_14330 [Bradyrhizobium valentinum]